MSVFSFLVKYPVVFIPCSFLFYYLSFLLSGRLPASVFLRPAPPSGYPCRAPHTGPGPALPFFFCNRRRFLLYFVPKTRFGLFVFWCTAPIIGFVLGFFTVRSFFGVIFFATIHLVILYFLQSGPPQQRKKKHYAATFHHL